MNVSPPDPTRPLRRQVYGLMIAVAAAVAAGRILSAENVVEPHLARPADARPDDRTKPWPTSPPKAVPTFGSNDRSRWATVRALVDEGTYVVGRRDRGLLAASDCGGLAATDPLSLAAILRVEEEQRAHGCDRGVVFEDGWTTIDKVLHPDRLEYYSSKPPLLPTLVAGEYWLLKHLFGLSIKDQPFVVIPIILLTINVLPLILGLWVLSRLAERYGTTDWGRLFVVAAGAFGTLVSTFLITFNNHTPAAFGALVALWAGLHVAFPAKQVLAKPGEPAGSSRRDKPGGSPPPRWTDGAGWLILAGLAAGFTATCELPSAVFAAALALLLLVRAPGRTLVWFAPALLLPVAALLFTNYLALGQILPAYEKTDTIWYQYEGSVWRTEPGEVRYGIEFARRSESRGMYAFHLLFGHHGWFSLTPIHLLGAAGMALAVGSLLRRWTRGRAPPVADGWDVTAAGAFAASLVVFVFYAFVIETANYGGWTNGPRWLLWLTPLWLFALLPVADGLGRRRWGRVLGLVLLALSVMSANYSDWDPWRHPWIYNWMEARGWLPY